MVSKTEARTWASEDPVVADNWSNAAELVPAEFARRCRELFAHTDALCERHLNTECKVLCRKMVGSTAAESACDGRLR